MGDVNKLRECAFEYVYPSFTATEYIYFFGERVEIPVGYNKYLEEYVKKIGIDGYNKMIEYVEFIYINGYNIKLEYPHYDKLFITYQCILNMIIPSKNLKMIEKL